MSKLDKSWQSRMSKTADERAVDFVESISVDARLYKYDIAGSIAHAQMLSEQGLLTRDEFQAIKKGLVEIAERIDAGTFRFDKRHEDIHMAIEAALIKQIGAPGQKLHSGRSRNDQVALDVRLWLRDEIAAVIERITAAQKQLVRQADRQGQIVMPGYTHLQRAQPVLLGAYLLAFAEQLQRDRERFEDAAKRVNTCPLGSGALAGSSMPLDRHRVAELLGFAGVTRNSIDSVADRDYCVEFVFACAMTAMHLSRLAEDWIIYATDEFGFITIDDAFCTGSSMMPQKRNPDILELVRGKSSQLYGNLLALLTMLKAQPMTYNRDMQEDKKQLFDAADTIASCLEMTAAIVANTTFNRSRIEQRLDRGFLDATALAEYLVRRTVPFRQAHQVVGRLVSRCEAEGISLAQMPLAELQGECKKIDADVYDSLGAAHVVAGYATYGAAGKQQLAEQLTFWHKTLT